MRPLHDSRGQSLVEFAVVLPVLCLAAFGLIEVSYALLHQHVVAKLTREGSNLISRDVSLQDAAAAMRSMSTQPVDFDGEARLVLSVIKRVATTGAANYDRVILYQRHEIGGMSGATSRLHTQGPGTFRGAPDYEAVNSDNDTNLQITNLPAGLSVPPGGLIYVTEIFAAHERLTPLDAFGVSIPRTLYSVAYF
jgi:hypothetical protein